MFAYFQALADHRWRIMHLPGVLGVGIGYKVTGGNRTDRLALAVFVAQKRPLSELRPAERIPPAVGGVPTDVVAVGEFTAFSRRTARRRPAMPGVSIGHYRSTAGTFGAVVYDAATREPLILSNNHILANATDGKDGRAQAGDSVLQPGPYDGGRDGPDTIGRLARFVPISFRTAAPTCPIARRFERGLNNLLAAFRPQYSVRLVRRSGSLNLVDAAVAAPVKPSAVRPEILELGPVHGTNETVQLGDTVKISGRTSGVSMSTVTYINATVTVAYTGNRTAVFEDQILAGNFSGSGDSGSLVVDTSNRAAGLLFAGSATATVFNPIAHVTRLLGVDF